jgi:replicative DNA helicase
MTSPIDYATRGWQIFPCHSIERGRCTCKLGLKCDNPGKHPLTQHGFLDASTNINQINGWIAHWPNANWALRTGPETGFTVIDIDPRHGGYDSFARLQQQRGSMPDTLRSATGGGGRHLLYMHPLGVQIPSVRGWLPGVDIKSDGGYVILPEGRHKSGVPYRWINWEIQPSTPLPPDIANMIMNRPSASSNGLTGGDLASTADILMGVPEGERDETLFRWACRLRRQLGDDGRRIVELAVLDAAANCTPPFPSDEALRKVEQAFRQPEEELPVGFVKWEESVTQPMRQQETAERSARLQLGGDFILDEPEIIPAIWGQGERVLWPEGEGIMITGHQGVGKTTVAEQLVLHRIGLRAGDFLGLPVTKSDRPILYLAMDRPRQAARSFHRMIADSDRQLLNGQLFVWRGPLPVDPTRDKDQFADFAEEICPNVGTIIADSVKDFAPGISDDKIGSALNLSWQEVIARDIQLMLLHHERKAPNGTKRVHSLDDVYGSTWLTAGLGSVIVLDGEPGDPTVELRHLKQPAEPVGPLTLRHDHSIGSTILFDSRPDLLNFLITTGSMGVTAAEAARVVIGRAAPSDLRTIRRNLNQLVDQHLAIKQSGNRTKHGAEPDRWHASALASWSPDENL